MKAHVQVALSLVALLYLSWGLGLLLVPGPAHGLLSLEPYNVTTAAMFGASLFAFATLFLIAAHAPERDIVYVSAVALLFIGFTAAYQMFVVKSMPQSVMTVISLVLNLGTASYLLISLTEGSHGSAARVRGALTKNRRARTLRRLH